MNDSVISQDDANEKQRLFHVYDGISYTLQVMNMTYARLIDTLLSISNNPQDKSHVHRCHLSAIDDAWSLIDSTNRLHNLLDSIWTLFSRNPTSTNNPRLKKKLPEIQLFLRDHKNILLLRNTIQHIENHITQFVAEQRPLLGVLSWATWNPSDKFAKLYMLSTGIILEKREYPFVNPCGQQFRQPIDLVTLFSLESVCLSRLIDHTTNLARALSNNLKFPFSLESQSMLASVELHFN